MLSALDVARYFLAITDEDSGEYISHLKLQKLCYYAQGFNLAIYGRKLFPETIEAWQHGPVIPDLWHEYKRYRSGVIKKPDDIDLRLYSANAKALLGDVYDLYGQFSAWKLRNMTHEEPPYVMACKRSDRIITPDSMKKYFATLVE